MNEPKKTHVAGISSAASFTNRVLIIAAIAALALIAWRLASVFVLLFAAIVLGMVLRALSEPISRRTGLPQRWALALVVVVLLGGFAVAAWFFGDRIAQQLGQIIERLPQAWEQVKKWLEQFQAGRYLVGLLNELFVGANNQPGYITGLARTTFGAVVDAAVILVIGLYLAAEPKVYRRGMLKLAPPRARPTIEAALDAVVEKLKRWLMGQAVAMLCIGVLTGIGLWALGIPYAFALAILAGLLEFIPYIGPFLAAVPAVLLAFTLGPAEALYVMILYAVVQEFEGWALVPLIEKWAVKVPPVLTILSVVIFGVLFGILGVVVAAPLMIVVMVLVQKLYVEGTLGDKA